MTNPLSDPIAQSIATALAGQAATALTETSKKALEKIRELLKRKSEDDPVTSAKWEAAEDRAPDHPKVGALAEHLTELAADDPELGEALRENGEVLVNELDGGVVNNNYGNVENLVQGRDFGNITFN